MNSNLQTVLINLMQKQKLSMSQLHRHTGVPITTIQRIKDDPTLNPSVASLLPIANYFNITINQLIGVDELPPDEALHKKNNIIQIPVIDWRDIRIWPKSCHYEPEKYLTIDLPLNENSFGLRIEHHLLNFPMNSIIVINFLSKPINNDYVIITNNVSNNASLFQYIEFDGVEYLKPLIEGIPPKKLNKKNDVLIGKILQIRLDL